MRLAKVERKEAPYWRVHERVLLCWRHYIQHLAQVGEFNYTEPAGRFVGNTAVWCAQCHEELGRQAELDFPWENGMTHENSKT